MDKGSALLVAGSFRDRDGRVYREQNRIFRGLSSTALENYKKLAETEFYQALLKSGKIIGTRLLPDQENPLPAVIKSQWAGFLEHETIPVVSYPYEWSFGMLRSAALLQLNLVGQAISNGFTLKDATPYNIQFVDRKPVFIDIPSFEPLQEGEPWTGYRQFCEMFLFPLLVQSYKNCNFQPFMRGSIDGIGVQTAPALFGFRDRFRKGVLSHVWLQAKLDRRYGGSSDNVRSHLKSAGFNRELILVNVRKMKKLVQRLAWEGAGSEWGDYAEFHNYSEHDHRLKEDFVREAISESRPGTVWDIGCNTGQFSKVAAPLCRQVVAMDIDHLAVERLFQNPDIPSNVLPLLQNVSDPSPNWGWKNSERSDLQSRSKPDLVLCLALIHHVVITANIPLAEFIEWLAQLTDRLVIEYVSRKDDKVQILLRNKDDKYTDYSKESLLASLEKFYTIEQQLDVNNGERTLFYCVNPANEAG
ncbi:MAG: class I SAM-dependent methyltransferase [Xanthomonadales bacterium]|jgi:SAM-dependent methyltransferase|nr:class I SAM-dependent methyltransferase [Xanthomonadales bacterium]MDH3925028.1 class I SAM-dependent methyltransferase [Xanthomonadales bacterium]MDH3939820.1 class I SAM-dependent methyltransferase [Xanthomonadales bacterium]MDH4001787.1 class I SAM-dependent methyltransferase [Xanthomonadales bacterium]